MNLITLEEYFPKTKQDLYDALTCNNYTTAVHNMRQICMSVQEELATIAYTYRLYKSDKSRGLEYPGQIIRYFTGLWAAILNKKTEFAIEDYTYGRVLAIDDDEYYIRLIRYRQRDKKIFPDSKTILEINTAKMLSEKFKTPVSIHVDEQCCIINVISNTENYETILPDALIALLKDYAVNIKLYQLLQDCALHPDEISKYVVLYFKENQTDAEQTRLQRIMKKSTIRKINETKKSIESCTDEIEDLLQKLNNVDEERKAKIGTLMLLEKDMSEKADTSKFDEVKEFLKDCYNADCTINVVDGQDLGLYVTGKSFLTIFDEDPAKRIFHSMLEMYKTDDHYRSYSDRSIEMFNMLFIKKEYKVAMSYGYILNVDRFHLQRDPNFTELENTVQHPHIMRFNCWGSHNNEVRKFKATDNVLGAISQAQYATEQINILDSCVLQWLLSSITNSDYSNRLILQNVETGERCTYCDIKTYAAKALQDEYFPKQETEEENVSDIPF